MRLNHTTPKGFCGLKTICLRFLKAETKYKRLNEFEEILLNQFSELLIAANASIKQNLLGDHSIVDPPDSMPNSEVKHNSADGSVGLPHVRVGHRQALISTYLERDEST